MANYADLLRRSQNPAAAEDEAFLSWYGNEFARRGWPSHPKLAPVDAREQFQLEQDAAIDEADDSPAGNIYNPAGNPDMMVPGALRPKPGTLPPAVATANEGGEFQGPVLMRMLRAHKQAPTSVADPLGSMADEAVASPPVATKPPVTQQGEERRNPAVPGITDYNIQTQDKATLSRYVDSIFDQYDELEAKLRLDRDKLMSEPVLDNSHEQSLRDIENTLNRMQQSRMLILENNKGWYKRGASLGEAASAKPQTEEPGILSRILTGVGDTAKFAIQHPAEAAKNVNLGVEKFASLPSRLAEKAVTAPFGAKELPFMSPAKGMRSREEEVAKATQEAGVDPRGTGPVVSQAGGEMLLPVGPTIKAGQHLKNILKGGAWGGGSYAAERVASDEQVDDAGLATSAGVGGTIGALLSILSRGKIKAGGDPAASAPPSDGGGPPPKPLQLTDTRVQPGEVRDGKVYGAPPAKQLPAPEVPPKSPYRTMMDSVTAKRPDQLTPEEKRFLLNEQRRGPRNEPPNVGGTHEAIDDPGTARASSAAQEVSTRPASPPYPGSIYGMPGVKQPSELAEGESKLAQILGKGKPKNQPAIEDAETITTTNYKIEGKAPVKKELNLAETLRAKQSAKPQVTEASKVDEAVKKAEQELTLGEVLSGKKDVKDVPVQRDPKSEALAPAKASEPIGGGAPHMANVGGDEFEITGKTAPQAPMGHEAKGAATRNVGRYKGKEFWIGTIDQRDNRISEIHPFEKAQENDFHHRLYFSDQGIRDLEAHNTDVFWFDDKGKIVLGWEGPNSGPEYNKVVKAIQSQLDKPGATAAEAPSIKPQSPLREILSKGKPQQGTFYHGTTADNAKGIEKEGFKLGKGTDKTGPAVFFTKEGDKSWAEMRTAMEPRGAILERQIDKSKLADLRNSKLEYDSPELAQVVAKAKADGKAGIMLPTETVVWDTSAIAKASAKLPKQKASKVKEVYEQELAKGKTPEKAQEVAEFKTDEKLPGAQAKPLEQIKLEDFIKQKGYTLKERNPFPGEIAYDVVDPKTGNTIARGDRNAILNAMNAKHEGKGFKLHSFPGDLGTFKEMFDNLLSKTGSKLPEGVTVEKAPAKRSLLNAAMQPFETPDFLMRKYAPGKEIVDTANWAERQVGKRVNDLLYREGKDGGYTQTKLFKYFEMAETERAKVNKILVLGDKRGEVYSPEMLRKAGLNDEEIAAYEGVREALKDVRKWVKHGVESKEDFDFGEIEGYIPRVWHGQMEIYKNGAKHLKDDGTSAFQTEREAIAEAYRLKKADPKAKLEIRHFADPDYLGGRAFQDAQVVSRLKKNLEAMGSKATADIDRAYEMGRDLKGFVKHLQERKGETGYEVEGLDKVLFNYFHKAAKMVEMQNVRETVKTVMKDHARELTPDQVRYLQNYVERVAGRPTWDEVVLHDMIGSTGLGKMLDPVQGGRGFRKLREFTNHLNLGLGNIAWATVNVDTLIRHVWPALQREANKYGNSSIVDAEKYMADGLYDFFRDKNLRQKLAHEGVVDIQLMSESRPQVGHKFGKGKWTPDRISMALGMQTEEFVRSVSAIARYKMALAHGESEQAALKAAARFVDETSGRYTKAGKPAAFTGSVVGENIGMYKTYMSVFAQNAFKAFGGVKDDPGTFVRYMVATMGVSGLLGLPGVDDLDELLTKHTGWSPIESLQKTLPKGILTGIASVAPGAMGHPEWNVDLSKKAGAGDLIPNDLWSALGPIINRYGNAIGDLAKGEYKQAGLDLLPNSLKGPVSLWMGKDQDVVMGKYDKPSYRLKPGESAPKMLGFPPAGEVEEQRRTSRTFHKEEHRNERLKVLTHKMAQGTASDEERSEFQELGGTNRRVKGEQQREHQTPRERQLKHLPKLLRSREMQYEYD